MKWEDLNTIEKSDLISLFVKGGIINLDQMHKLYDNGGDINTLNNPKYNKDAENRIYDYLRYRGLSHNQASAFMGNIAVESLLNADINQENGGPAKGLLQTESDRYKKLQQYNEVPYEFGTELTPDEQHQLDYFINKGVKNYTSGEWGRKGYKSARDVRMDFNNPNKSAQELSDILMRNYFRPGKPQEKRRDKMADYYDNKMSTRFPYRIDEWGQYYYDKELNRYDVGGPLKSNIADTFLTDWYSSPTTQNIIHQIEEQNGLLQSDVNKEVQTALETPQYILEEDNENPIPTGLLRTSRNYLNRSVNSNYVRDNIELSRQYRNAKSQEERDELLRQDDLKWLSGADIQGLQVPNQGIIYKQQYYNPSLETHELDHTIQERLPHIVEASTPIEYKLRKGVEPNSYLDDKREIRSRIMQLRQINNLSPEKRNYKAKDAKRFISRLKDKQLRQELERLDYQTVADYLNYMADNSDYKLNVNYAAEGGFVDNEESYYGGELEPAVVKPEPLKATLFTYYPITSSQFPLTGHSQLNVENNKYTDVYTKMGNDYDYNLLLNNCSDETRRALEAATGKEINPLLFTTPGDVRDFVRDNYSDSEGYNEIKSKGMLKQEFYIPYASAREMYNQKIDNYIIPKYKRDINLRYDKLIKQAKSREEVIRLNEERQQKINTIIKSFEGKKYKIKK